MRLHNLCSWAGVAFALWMAASPAGYADCASGDGNLTSPGLCTTPQNLTGGIGTVVAGATLSTGPDTTAYTMGRTSSGPFSATLNNAGTITSTGPQALLMVGNASLLRNVPSSGNLNN